MSNPKKSILKRVKTKSESKPGDHASNSWTIKKIIISEVVKVAFFLFRFKQLPIDIKWKFKFSFKLIDRKRPLSLLVGVVSFLAKKPLDSHVKKFSVSPSLFKL